MHKSIIKRIRKIQTQTLQPRWRVVVKDTDGLYRGECGHDLSEEKFQTWSKLQDADTQIIIVEVSENTEANLQAKTTFKVENLACRNSTDLLKSYQEAFQRAHEVDILCPGISDEYSEEEKNAVLEAYKIISKHRPQDQTEGLH